MYDFFAFGIPGTESCKVTKTTCCLWPLVAVVLLFSLSTGLAEYIADGVKLTQLTDDGRSMAVAWAYHGNLIAFVREVLDSQVQLMIMNSDGTNEVVVTPVCNVIFAEWSWAGDKLSYEISNTSDEESQGGIYIYDVATGRSKPISAPYPRSAIDEDEGPFWSPDDRYVVYKVRPGPSRSRQVWVADTETGKYWQLMPERGEAKEARWSPIKPPRICLLVESSGGEFDVANVGPEGRDLILLTDIGAQDIDNDEPRWSPDGQWIAYTSDIDMTQTERERKLEDCWIVRPDGSEARNLTKATTPSTEKQLDIDEPFWSWDGRWILIKGSRFDNLGNSIPTLYLIDPVNGGYKAALTSYPQETGEFTKFESFKWSYDSTKIAIAGKRSRVKNWGPDAEFENEQWVLGIYSLGSGKFEDLLVFDEEIDRKKILADIDRQDIEDISWSPDNSSLLVTIATIVSASDGVRHPDIYRVDLPARLIDDSASEHIGPPMGREKQFRVRAQTASKDTEPTKTKQQTNGEEFVTEVIKPLHMPVEEAVSSLLPSYAQYFTTNPTRNLLLFKGPRKVLKALRKDLELIDSEPPHILVDFLAIELTDEANRSLGLDWTYVEGHFGFFQPIGSSIQKFPHVGTDEDYRVGFPSGALDSLSTAGGQGQSFFQGVGRLPREFYIRLNSLIRDGQATILANPRTVAMSGKESLINIRKTLNYFFNEGFDVAGRPIVKKSDISADTEGLITPRLLPDGRIHLTVDVKVGTFTFTKDAGLPELTTRRSTTEVTVEDGQTIVIGGLRQQEMSSATTKVPLLGDLPLIGGLFKQQQRDIRETVLTILITPQVMNSQKTTPKWPQLNPEDYKFVPIMKEPQRKNPEEAQTNSSEIEILEHLLKVKAGKDRQTKP